jgi:L,D-transpeptidase YcbB
VGEKTTLRLSIARIALPRGRSRAGLVLAVILVALCTMIGASDASPPADQMQGELRALIEAGTLPESRWPKFAEYQQQVRKFYGAGGYSLAWIQGGRPTPQALAIIEQFKQARFKGLDPREYDASNWDARVQRLGSGAATSELASFDLALTFCAMRYISDLHIGRANPNHLKFSLELGAYNYDLAEVVRNQVIRAADLKATLESFEPPYAGYRRIETALVDYLKLAAQGDGLRLPLPAKSIKPGDMYVGMTQLLWRLRQLGDLPAAGGATETPPTSLGPPAPYDDVAVAGVKHFQGRHGLEIDGVLGKNTIVQLNRPLSSRVWQLDLTLERYRWLAPKFPQPPIIVNIPEFRLRTMRRQPASFLSMRIVVGKAYHHRTPVFEQNMRYVIFRPYWLVPLSIQRDELVPKIRHDPNYLAENDYEVVDDTGEIVTEDAVSDDVMHGLQTGALSIRQKPGLKNALGLIKFMFPNVYNVYLHSTPSPRLFAKARRDFSHGCIRIADPVGLAVWVLRGVPGWTAENVEAAMNDTDHDDFRVTLPKPIPVLILYTTAVVEPDGEVRFFDDIYGYDAELKRALEGGFP